MSIRVVYITFSDQLSARNLTDRLLQARLVACANIDKIESCYWWQGDLCREDEYVAICKTSNDRWPELKQKAEAWHPYEVPCIVSWQAEANDSYEQWVINEVRPLD